MRTILACSVRSFAVTLTTSGRLEAASSRRRSRQPFTTPGTLLTAVLAPANRLLADCGIHCDSLRDFQLRFAPRANLWRAKLVSCCESRDCYGFPRSAYLQAQQGMRILADRSCCANHKTMTHPSQDVYHVLVRHARQKTIFRSGVRTGWATGAGMNVASGG